MTYGQLRFRLSKAFPSVDPDLIEGWIGDRYAEILGELPWSRENVRTTLTTVIGQAVYPMPADCRMLQDNAFASLERFDRSLLDQSDPNRERTDAPGAWASYMDDNSTPPLMQVELYPVPNLVTTLPFTYSAEKPPLGLTSTIMQVWIQPAALIEGTSAKIKTHLKDYVGAQMHAASAQAALHNMRTSEAQGLAPATMQLDDYYTRHRIRRWQR